MKAFRYNIGTVELTGNKRDLGHGLQYEVIYSDTSKGWEHKEDLELSHTHSLSEFKKLLRMNDLSGDPWGVSVSAWFDCAAHLYEKGNCPFEWEYRPGSMGNVIETDSTFFDMFSEMSAEQLEEVGQLLWRYSNLLKRHGRDY